jgi:hypothetical protein
VRADRTASAVRAVYEPMGPIRLGEPSAGLDRAEMFRAAY